MRKDLTCAMALSVLLAGCAGPEVRVVKIAEKLHQIEARYEGDPAKIPGLAARFKMRDLSEQELKNYSDRTIRVLYDAVSQVTFHSPEEERFIGVQEAVLEEKLRRAPPNDYDIGSMYKTYLDARMFAKAESIKKRFPDTEFPSAPDVIISANPTGATRWRAYDVLDDGRKVELQALPLEEGWKVVMVMFPGCGVAERAMGEILSDPELAGAFKEHGLLVTALFDAEGVAKWRSHFGFRRIYIASKRSDFPGFEFSSSPRFYFMKRGKITFQFEGWSGSRGPQTSKASWLKGLLAVADPATAPAAP
ncbi:MAG: hypothetical protein HY748_07060 [Elusimicrobia bacterium]|nr:hypothetical protein [Elusimicrobiota bacterium]